MPQPVVFISHFRVKEGKLDDFRRRSEENTRSLEQEKPATVAFLAYLSDDRTQLSIVHVFPDAASMDAHVEGAEERAAAAYEFIEPAGWDIYGRPSDGVLEMMRRSAASAGVPLVHHPDHLTGFLRMRAG